MVSNDLIGKVSIEPHTWPIQSQIKDTDAWVDLTLEQLGDW